MGKKYIVEIGDNEALYKTFTANSGRPCIGIVYCKPYTEPDIDKVKADAYSDGYKAGREAENVRQPDLEQVRKEAYDTAYADAEEIYESGKEAMYQKGLKDAWECARKIASDNAGQNYSIFGQHFTVEILNTHSASECIEEIQAYEQAQKEKEEQIQVGDEVIYNGTITCVVFSPENDKRYASIIDADGIKYSADHRDLTKTGRHFPEIAEVMQKMKEKS